MKILLLNPPFPASGSKSEKFSRASRSPAITKSGTLYYPLWLAYAAGALEKNGFEIKLVDAPARSLGVTEVLNIAKDFNPSLVIIETSTPSIYDDAKMAEAIKKSIGNVFTILVGTHPSALPEETLRLNDSIDAVARSEYDYTVLELAKVLSAGGSLKGVLGISFKDNNVIVHNKPRPLIEKLDELPFVSRVYKEHLNIDDYFFAAGCYPFVMIITGRGCPFRCGFCLYPQVFHSRRYRSRSAGNIADEFEYIAREFPQVREIGIEDDTFTADKRRVRDFCSEIIKRQINLPWYANTRADLDYDTMQLMKKAGCRLLIAGFESGSQKILDNVNKCITLKEMKRFARDAKKAGLLIHGCFMIGNPGETRATARRTVRFALKLGCDTAQFFPLIAYPGTETYEWAKNNGYLKTEDFSKWLTSEGGHASVVGTEELSEGDILNLCADARRVFYLRLGYIFYKAVRCLRDPQDFKRTLKAFKIFYKHLF